MFELSLLLLNIAGIFMFFGVLGLYKFKDVYMKIHSTTMFLIGGIVLSILIFSFTTPSLPIKLKSLLIILLLILTAPTSSHLIALIYHTLEEKVDRND